MHGHGFLTSWGKNILVGKENKSHHILYFYDNQDATSHVKSSIQSPAQNHHHHATLDHQGPTS